MAWHGLLDYVAVVELGFKKRMEREAAMAAASSSLGLGRLLSLAYTASGVMEIGGPLATAILLEGGAVTTTCNFERLVLVEGFDILNNVTVEAAVVSSGDELFTETSISKYIDRPKCLETCCWYDYCAWYRRTARVSTREAASCTLSSANATVLHDHVKCHGLRRFKYPRVPEIIGPRLPNASRLGDEDYSTQSELFYRMVALLYHPFRTVRTILDENESAHTLFLSWNPFGDTKTSRALEHHQQYHICLRMAEQYRQEQQENGNSDDDDEECVDDDILPNDPDDVSPPTRYSLVPAEYYDADFDDDMEASSELNAQVDTPIPAIRQLLLHSITSLCLPADVTESYVASGTSISRVDVTRSISKQSAAQEHQVACATAQPTHNLVVHAFDDAVRHLAYDASSPRNSQIGVFASISAVSKSFGLNHNQHTAFTLIAVPLLSAITGLDISPARAKLFNNSPIIITGAGGTGKSQIVSAVRAIVCSWNQHDSVAVVASTGIAASNLNGSTMHSSVGLGINATKLPKHISNPNDRVLRKWAPVLCIIADEVSMVDLGFFGLWEDALRHVKDATGSLFGGMLAVLMFDHCQLRPVNGAPMFKTCMKDRPLTALQDRGRVLYSTISKVVYLTDNMRFANDPEWGEWLASARLGTWPAQLRSHISTLPDFDMEDHQHPAGIIQTVSTDNATRASVNDTAIELAVQTVGQRRKVYVIRAQLSRPLTRAELPLIRGLLDNQTGNVPVFLHAYIGMPVRIKTNQCVPRGVVNGASGVIYHID